MTDKAFHEFVGDVIDDQVAALRQEVVDGRVLTTGETLAMFDQLINDRAKLRAMVQKQEATVQ